LHERNTFNMDFVTKFKLLLNTILIIVFFTSCEKACDCLKSTGQIDTEYRNIANFNEIHLGNNIDLVIHIDTITKIKVTAGKNLLSEIITENNNGVLKIKNENNCNWVRDYNKKIVVEVWTDSLKRLNVYDAIGDIYFDDTLNCNEFYFQSFGCTGQFHLKLNGSAHLDIINGSADLKVIGNLNNLYLYNDGYGKMDCLNLPSVNVFITNSGTNNCYVNAQQLIEAKIYGGGNIYYKGNPPTVIKKELGQGKLISL